jgi:hypothetical protein
MGTRQGDTINHAGAGSAHEAIRIAPDAHGIAPSAMSNTRKAVHYQR